MWRCKSLMTVLSLLIVCGGLSACRSVGSALGDRNAELRTGQWWVGPIPDATPLKPQDRTAWISYKNVTQEQSYDLRAQLRQGVEAQGYRLTDDPDQANFHVFSPSGSSVRTPVVTKARGRRPPWGALRAALVARPLPVLQEEEPGRSSGRGQGEP